MITAGDERGKSQGGNNNAYCQDNVITWQSWDPNSHQLDFEATVAHLIALRKKYAGLRPEGFANASAATEGSDLMLWFNEHGEPMSEEDWNNPDHRVLQRYSEHKDLSGLTERLLLVLNGAELPKQIRLAPMGGPAKLELLWDSALELPPKHSQIVTTGSHLTMVETSLQLFLVLD